MSTPKEKLTQGQALNAKRKKFFRILQSASNGDGRFCAPVPGDRIRAELEAKMTAVFEAAKAKQSQTENSTVQPGSNNTNKSKKELRKLRKLNAKNAKSVKCPDLIVGMESTLRLIDRKQVAMVWIDSSLASNLVNVVHKLCIVNHIFCLDLDLSLLMRLSNIKSITMVSFRSAVQQAESPLHDLYQFVVTSVFRPAQTQTHAETTKASSTTTSNAIEPANEDNKQDSKLEPDKQQQQSLPPQSQQSSTTFLANFNFYLTNEDDQYTQIMKRRLLKSQTDDSAPKDDIASQASLIVFSQPKEEYFPAYDDYGRGSREEGSEQQRNFQVKITIEQKESKAQKASSANRLTEKLFDIDKLNSSIESSSNNNSRTTFKSPKMVKGEVLPLSTAGKRKRANKDKNKNNQQSNKKAKQT